MLFRPLGNYFNSLEYYFTQIFCTLPSESFIMLMPLERDGSLMPDTEWMLGQRYTF